MLLLPTCGRPKEVAELIQAWRKAGETAPVHVLIDDSVNPHRDGYEDLHFDEDRGGPLWPAGWDHTEMAEHHELTQLLNTGLRMFGGPGSPHAGEPVGFFGDHFRPLTPFAARLAAAAQDWFIAWPNDGGALSGAAPARGATSHKQPSGCVMFGPKLIDALGGWIMLPTTWHCCTDRVWWHLWRTLGICKHVEDVHFTRTWPVGQGSVPRVFRGQDLNAHDFAAWKSWERHQAPAVIALIRAGMVADGFSFDSEGRIDPRHGCTKFQEGW